MTDRGPLVSVVTPFYNTEAFLAEAIESVLGQTYRNFELVLVDNCSTDRSSAIAEDFARRDPRVRLLHNEHFLSQIQNYNQALRRISPAARYCKVVQADDAIFPTCLDDMVRLAEAHPSVGLVASYRMEGTEVKPSGLPHTRTVMAGQEACRIVLSDDIYLFGSPTSVMVRSEIVRARDPFYDEHRLYPDTDAAFEILRDHDFGFVHQILSYTRIHDSIFWGRQRSFGAGILTRLIQLKTHGPHYLSPEECDQCIGSQEAVYRRFLGEAWLRRAEPDFWELHRKGLASIGETLEQASVHRHALGVAIHYLCSPRVVMAALGRRARVRLGAR